MISQIVDKSKAAGEFKLGYALDVGMIFVVEFNLQKVLVHISVLACIAGRAKTLERDHCQARETGLVAMRWVKAQWTQSRRLGGAKTHVFLAKIFVVYP
jgi:hypothetical protein